MLLVVSATSSDGFLLSSTVLYLFLLYHVLQLEYTKLSNLNAPLVVVGR